MPAKNEDLGRNLTFQEAAEYTKAYKKGSDLVRRHMALPDREPAPPSPAGEAELREGIVCLPVKVTATLAWRPGVAPGVIDGVTLGEFRFWPRVAGAFRDVGKEPLRGVGP